MSQASKPDLVKKLTTAKIKNTKEHLVNMVRDGILRAGILWHQYKFKMLSLDQGGGRLLRVD